MRARIKVVMETTENIISKELKKQIAELLEAAREDFRTIEGTKKERLLKLAKDIESLGLQKDMICETITKALENEIGERYIQKVLPEEFKRKYEKNEKNEKRPCSLIDNKKDLEDKSSEKLAPLSDPIEEKKVRESSVTQASQRVIEQSIRTNGIIEISRPINPNPIQEAHHKEELEQNPSINTDLMIPNEQLQEEKQEEKNNPLQSVVDKLLEEKTKLAIII